MGISDGSVGDIVWVQRRNGTWWPGKILGPDDLPGSDLKSPRCGTPVKLLGREDASVDWYNLEKSKRVKAFRCGDFDECIEQAEIFQGNGVKRGEKNARRGDAILHALELERQLLGKKQQRLDVGVIGAHRQRTTNLKNELRSAENVRKNRRRSVNVSQVLSRRQRSYLEKASRGDLLYLSKDKQGRPPRWENDNTGSLPRGKGLQDFGLRNAAKKRKWSSSITVGSSQKPLAVDNHIDNHHGVAQSIEGGTSKYLLSGKQKSTSVNLAGDSLDRRRGKRRSPGHVLQGRSKLLPYQSLHSDAASISRQGEKEQQGIICRSKRSKCVYLPAGSNDCSTITEFPMDKMQLSQTQIERNSSLVILDSTTDNNSSCELKENEGSYFSVEEDLNQETDDEMVMVSDQMLTFIGPRNSCNSNEGQSGSMSSEELDNSVATGYVPQLQYGDRPAVCDVTDVGVQKWKMRGKWNFRNLAGRPKDLVDVENHKRSVQNGLNKEVFEQGVYHVDEDLNDGFNEDRRYGNRRYTSTSNAAVKGRGRSMRNMCDSEALWAASDPHRVAALRGCWDGLKGCSDPIYNGLDDMMESMLVDANLTVQASHRGGERVPLVSLMSRLNGKAIVGYPVQVEGLEDVSSDSPCNTEGEEAPEYYRNHRSAVFESKLPYKKAVAKYFSHESKLISKNIPNSSRVPIGNKLSTKLLKKVSLSSQNQKAGVLPSISIGHGQIGKSSDLKLGSKNSLNPFINADEEGVGPTHIIVTCIPLKLVYSRLLEAVGKPSSKKAESHGVLINATDTETQETQAY